MLKPYSKFQGSIIKHFKVILPFTSHFSPVLIQRFCSLAQAVTSQAENIYHLKGLLIAYMMRYIIVINLFMVHFADLFVATCSIPDKSVIKISACHVTVSFPSSLSR